MAHEIFGERFVSVREPAWHRIGTVIDAPVPTSEALKLANVTYGVATKPLLYQDPSGKSFTDSGYVAVVRDATPDDPNELVLGTAKGYELIHVTDVNFDDIEFPISTVGALRHGAEIFMTYDMGDREIVGEAYKMFMTIVHPYAPGYSWRVMLTPVRVVCQNTLIMGENAATAKISVSHHAGARARVDTALVMARAQAMEHRALHRLKALADKALTPDDVDRVLTVAYPAAQPKNFVVDPTPDDLVADKAAALYDYRVNAAEKLRNATKILYDRFNDEHPSHAATGYALYNAVVEHEDYRLGARTSESKAGELAVIGTRATTKVKTLNAILSLN